MAKLGFGVAFAENGFQAGLLANSIYPALIIIDLMMPSLDGVEAIKMIRQESNLKNTKILVVTGMDGPILEEAILAGANSVLPKPFDSDGLRMAIEQLMEKQDELQLA